MTRETVMKVVSEVCDTKEIKCERIHDTFIIESGKKKYYVSFYAISFSIVAGFVIDGGTEVISVANFLFNDIDNVWFHDSALFVRPRIGSFVSYEMKPEM